MKESVTYQAILEEGRLEGQNQGALKEARRFLLLLGENRFGPPDEATRTALEEINDLKKLEKLEKLGVQIIHATSWQDLLKQSSPRSRKPRQS